MKNAKLLSCRFALSALALCLSATAGWARADANVPIGSIGTTGSPATAIHAQAPSIADQIDSLLAARFAAAADMKDESRRQALENLSQFATLTVEGLIDASPTAEVRSLMDARLRPILDRYQHNIAVALTEVTGRPRAQNTFFDRSAADLSPVAKAP